MLEQAFTKLHLEKMLPAAPQKNANSHCKDILLHAVL